MRPTQALTGKMTAFLLAATLATAAVDQPRSPPHETPALAFSLGHVGIFDDLDEHGIASAEYRFPATDEWRLVPAIGVAGAENGAHFVYADLHYDFRFGEHLVLSPSFGVGRFGGSDEIDLGNLVEFRSGLEIAWEFDNGYRVGLVLHHLSNGGISERNPGIEELALTLHVPLGD